MQVSQQTAREALLCAKRQHDSVMVLIEQCLAAGVLTPADAAVKRAEAVATLSEARGGDLTAGEGGYKDETKDPPAPIPACAVLKTGILITPIAKSAKPKKSGPDSHHDYNEQCQRSASGQIMCWDDDKQNNTQVGDIFGFYKGNVCVEIHRVDAVQDPSLRLLSWSNNVGQQGRNVLVLSSLLCVIPWNDWVTFGWHASGVLLGTQRVANDQARVHMIHYINAILQRTQKPRFFPLVSEEGGAGRDKRTGAGTKSAVVGSCSGRARGRQVGSKNTARTRIDDLPDDTLQALGRELGLTVHGRAELVAGIHKASGATSKVPKTSLEPLSVAMLKRICVNRALSSLGDRSELIQCIQQGEHAKEAVFASQGREKGGEAGERVMDGALASEAPSATAGEGVPSTTAGEEGESDAAGRSRRGRGRRAGSKNTLRTRIDDLSDDTLRALGSELGLAVRDRAELVVGIHRASGATSKVPKTNLELLSVATLKRICAERALSTPGIPWCCVLCEDKWELIQNIQTGKGGKQVENGQDKSSRKDSSNTRKSKKPRTATKYNLFMREQIASVKAGDPALTHKEAFKRAAGNWAAMRIRNHVEEMDSAQPTEGEGGSDPNKHASSDPNKHGNKEEEEEDEEEDDDEEEEEEEEEEQQQQQELLTELLEELLDAKVTIPGSEKATWDKSRIGRGMVLSNNDSTVSRRSEYSGVGTSCPGALGSQLMTEGTHSFTCFMDECGTKSEVYVGVAYDHVDFPVDDVGLHPNNIVLKSNGNLHVFGSRAKDNFGSYTTGDCIGIEVDMAAKLVTFYKNDVRLCHTSGITAPVRPFISIYSPYRNVVVTISPKLQCTALHLAVLSALARPLPPAQQQCAPASYQGCDPSLSLAQALGQVLERYCGTLATEPDIDAKMRLHPQGANWRSCLEVMVEQSVRHGKLHPECPDIRQSVHCAAVRGVDGSVSQQIMVLDPAAAPFRYYCECIETMSQCLLPRAFTCLSRERTC